ncbi:MAG: carboxypeptidase-like regulatory domain-containing protein [Bacteroidales bacterium]|nr:carboxypeptidase-like regulatory domain-containing protein [Bacteroidales bacterium]MDD3892939.1 carboxypeptidase-like regulatory domain-containing protein [Bacteroidales bacterium]
MIRAKHSALINKLKYVIALLLLLHAPINYVFSQEQHSILQKEVTLNPQRTTIFKALSQLSDSIGYFFAYDSKAVQSDRMVRVSIKEISLKNALEQILNDTTLRIRVADSHILIYPAHNERDTLQRKMSAVHEKVTIKGRVVDASTMKPLPFATVGVPDIGLGNVANLDGIFVLALPADNSITAVTISHIGYKPRTIPISILQEGTIDIPLEINYISIQEVVIRNIEPSNLVKEAVQKIPDNFSQNPLYLMSFYREGVMMNEKYQNYSEAIFRIYKAPYSNNNTSDQVKLLKSRKTQNIEQTDTLSIKLKAGVHSSLMLDIAKNLPTFLDKESRSSYNYFKSDIITIDSKTAYQVYFTQNASTNDPLFTGVIYIDMESLAILGADFEVTPKHITKVAGKYLHKSSWMYRIKPVQIKYSVRYKEFNNKYYISHVRGDLDFRYRKRRSLFYNPFHLFFELMVSQSTSENVVRFKAKETTTANSVFFDTGYEYDEEFWSGFNYISPEQSVFDALNQINAKIEEITQEE